MAGSRPQFFTLDKDHTLAKGLVFAGLGCAPGSVRYCDSAAKNHGTLTNMTPAAWAFSKSLDRWSIAYPQYGTIYVPSINCGTENSAAIWALTTPSTAAFCGDSFYGGYFFAIETGGTVYYNACGTYTALASSVITTFPTHLAVRRSGTAVELFVNGVQRGTTQTLSSNTNGPVVVSLNGYADGSYTYASAVTTSDPMIWKRCLSLPEIRILANRSDPFLGGLIRPIGSESNIYDREGIR